MSKKFIVRILRRHSFVMYLHVVLNNEWQAFTVFAVSPVCVYRVATVRTCSSTVFLFTEIEYVSYKSVLDDANRRQPLVKVKNEDLLTFCAPRVDNMQFMTHTVCDVVSEYFTGYQTSQRKCLECETSVKYVIRFVRCGSRCFRVYVVNYTMLAELSIV